LQPNIQAQLYGKGEEQYVRENMEKIWLVKLKHYTSSFIRHPFVIAIGGSAGMAELLSWFRKDTKIEKLEVS